MRGQDAVVSALGRGLSFKSEHLIQRSVPPILSAMQSQGIQRLVFTSAIGVGETVHHVPLFPRLMARFPLRNIYADKAIGDDLIRRSALGDVDARTDRRCSSTDARVQVRERLEMLREIHRPWAWLTITRLIPSERSGGARDEEESDRAL